MHIFMYCICNVKDIRHQTLVDFWVQGASHFEPERWGCCAEELHEAAAALLYVQFPVDLRLQTLKKTHYQTLSKIATTHKPPQKNNVQSNREPKDPVPPPPKSKSLQRNWLVETDAWYVKWVAWCASLQPRKQFRWSWGCGLRCMVWRGTMD